MKKLFLSLLSLFVTASVNAYVEINSSNFPDENFRNWLLSQDYGADGILTEEEIAGVTKIDANMKSIQSLKGIEFFTALTTLECYNNQLTSLDVSKNAALTYIRFGGNKLTSLDVSKNTALRTLLCDDNPLTALDLSNNTLLTRLDCGSPNLKTLNISGCKALYELNLRGTQLTSLDLSGKTNLKVLRCGSNQLKTLNVSGCTSLRDFSCDGNQLTTLNVSGCTGLKELYCSNNQLTSIDATGCTKLRELQFNCNKIQGQAMDDFIASLPTTSGRTMFVINNENEGNVMTTAQAAAAKAKGWTPYYYENGWQEYTGSEPEVAGIAIDEKNFPDKNFRDWVLEQDYGKDGKLSEAEIAQISYINVSRNSIQNLKGIEFFTALDTLFCHTNQLTSLDVSKNTSLICLDCAYNQLTNLDISMNETLKSIYCFYNQLTSLDVSKNKELKTLWCFSNQINDNMNVLVKSLPITSNGEIWVLNSQNEGNVMTTAEATIAKAKGWKPLYYDGTKWQEYAGSEPEVMKCATPIIGFFGGKLIFRCETEDARYVCKVSDIEFETDGTGVSLPSKITISVYAKKDGYEDSDTISHEIDPRVLMGIIGDVNEDGTVNGTDIQEVINIIVNGE